MTALGLCINANGVVPDAEECAAIGLGSGDYVRTAVQGSLDLLPPMLDRVPRNVLATVTLNNECWQVGGDWSGLESACQELVRINDRYDRRIRIVTLGNELDLWRARGDWNLTPEFAASLVNRASGILRAGGIKVAMSSVASDVWPWFLEAMAWLCRGNADLADLHLYVKELNGIPRNQGWQSCNEAVREARRLSGLPVISSEAGIKIDDAQGVNEQAWWAMGLQSIEAELVCFFAWHDRVGTNEEQGGQAFGARDLNGNKKPVWDALQAVFGGPNVLVEPPSPPEPDRSGFTQGFKEWHDREPSRIGRAVGDSQGVYEGEVVQATSNGTLIWVGGKGHCFVRHDGRIYIWQEGQARSQQVR